MIATLIGASLYLYSSQKSTLKGGLLDFFTDDNPNQVQEPIDNGDFIEVTPVVEDFTPADRTIATNDPNIAVKVFSFTLANTNVAAVNLNLNVKEATQEDYLINSQPVPPDRLSFILKQKNTDGSKFADDRTYQGIGSPVIQLQNLALPRGKTVRYELYAYLKDVNAQNQVGKGLVMKFSRNTDVTCLTQGCIVVGGNGVAPGPWIGKFGPTFVIGRAPAAAAPAGQNPENQNEQFNFNLNLDTGAAIQHLAENIMKVTYSRPMQPLAGTIAPGFPYHEVLKVGLDPNYKAGLTGVKLKLLFDTAAQAAAMENYLGIKLFVLDKSRNERELTPLIQYFDAGSGVAREKRFNFSKVDLKKNDLFAANTCPCTLSVRVMQNEGNGERFKVQANDYYYSPDPQPAFDGYKVVEGNTFTLASAEREVVSVNGDDGVGFGVGPNGPISFGNNGGLQNGGGAQERDLNVGRINSITPDIIANRPGGPGVSVPGTIRNPNGGLFNPNFNLPRGTNIVPNVDVTRALQEAAARERQRIADEAAAAAAERQRVADESDRVRREDAARREAERQKAESDRLALEALNALTERERVEAEARARAAELAFQQALAFQRTVEANAALERQAAEIKAATERAAREQLAAREAAARAQANQTTQTQQQNNTVAVRPAAVENVPVSAVAAAVPLAQQPSLSQSTRLVYAPEQGSTGPGVALYFLIAGLSPALVTVYRKIKK